MLFKPIASQEWAPFLKVNWKPRPYEFALVIFALIVISLVYLYAPLPFSTKLAVIFIMNLGSLLLAVYALAAFVISLRTLRHIWLHGWRSCFLRENISTLILPYISLDFLLLTIRRAFSILAIIYFFLHLKHIILLVNTKNFDLFFGT